MLKKIKNILGIEGVKIELNIPEEVKAESGEIVGILKISSQSSQVVDMISLKLVEKYKRGRNEAKLIDEYVLGETILDEEMTIASDEIIEVPFTLEFINARSEMDKMGDDSIFLRGPVSLAKWIKNVSSSYRLEVHVRVKETKLQPFATVFLKAK